MDGMLASTGEAQVSEELSRFRTDFLRVLVSARSVMRSSKTFDAAVPDGPGADRSELSS